MRLLLILLLMLGSLQHRAAADEAIDALVEVLLTNTDPQFDADILKGLRDGLATTRQMPAPKHWETVEKRLRKSPNAEVRELTKLLSLKFGSRSSLDAYRRQLTNNATSVKERRAALQALVAAKDQQVLALATRLLDTVALRVDAIQALGQFSDPQIPSRLITRYPTFKQLAERRAALNVLVSRPAFARSLLDAVAAGTIPSTHLTADLVRQLRTFKDPTLNERVTRVWGVVRDSPADKQREIARYKRLLTAKTPTADARRGRPLFNLICGQCHMLFGEGGKVGPDITGANRTDLDYLLHNILDPNAEIPNVYRTTNIELKDDRSLTGIVTRQDAASVTLATAAETLTLSRKEIATLRQSGLSMMPEGLLQALNDQQTRDLIAYLQSRRQVPLPEK